MEEKSEIYDLKNKKKLDLVSIKELLGNKFYIPDYQRGYRWTKKEVTKLLEDLRFFFKDSYKKPEELYCLQPLVVFYNEKEKAWEVIDGQQRLTTILLFLMCKCTYWDEESNISIIKYINKNWEPYTIEYQTKSKGKNLNDYITNPEKDKSFDNIDYYHIFNVSNVMPNKINQDEAGNFVKNLINPENCGSVKFIWYNVTDEIQKNQISSEQKFSNLNIGKISLTNSELIKSLFLSKIKEEKESIRIATQWDEIEHQLQDDNFWAFIYGQDNKKYSTRIDFLIDIINDDVEQNSDYSTFDIYFDKLNPNVNEDPEKQVVDLWEKIEYQFSLFNGWYENRKLYHIIGFLRFLKVSIKDINDIFKKASDLDCFFKELVSNAENKLPKNIEELTYDKNLGDIYKTLLYFNIKSILKNEKDNVRFSFSDFYQNKWDIEHINCQTPKEKEGKDREEWIKCLITYFSGISDFKQDDVKKRIGDSFSVEEDKIKKICSDLFDLINEPKDITQEADLMNSIKEELKQNNEDFTYTDSIGNLVLLDAGTNRGYKNAFFPVKRAYINKRETDEGVYILPSTKKVFSKGFTEKTYDLMNWNNEDAEKYLEAIKKIIEEELD